MESEVSTKGRSEGWHPNLPWKRSNQRRTLAVTGRRIFFVVIHACCCLSKYGAKSENERKKKYSMLQAPEFFGRTR